MTNFPAEKAMRSRLKNMFDTVVSDKNSNQIIFTNSGIYSQTKSLIGSRDDIRFR